MDLCEELIAKTEAAKSGKFLDLWALYCFLNENSGLDLYLAVGNKLEQLAPNLTDQEIHAARILGCTFPDEWDNPKEYFGQKDDT